MVKYGKLGNEEIKIDLINGDELTTIEIKKNNLEEQLKKCRRFMVYIHNMNPQTLALLEVIEK